MVFAACVIRNGLENQRGREFLHPQEPREWCLERGGIRGKPDTASSNATKTRERSRGRADNIFETTPSRTTRHAPNSALNRLDKCVYRKDHWFTANALGKWLIKRRRKTFTVLVLNAQIEAIFWTKNEWKKKYTLPSTLWSSPLIDSISFKRSAWKI